MVDEYDVVVLGTGAAGLTAAVRAAADGAHVTWTADLLPDSLAEQVSPAMAHGLAMMKAHFEGSR